MSEGGLLFRTLEYSASGPSSWTYWTPSVSPEKVIAVSHILRVRIFLSVCRERIDISLWFVLLTCFFGKCLSFRFLHIFNSYCFFYGHNETRIQNSLISRWKPNHFILTGHIDIYDQNSYVFLHESQGFEFKSHNCHDSGMCYISLSCV